MKVLLATMGLGIGGAETHIVELAKGLKKKGIEVIVASNGGEYVKELEQASISHYNVPMHNKKITNVIKSYTSLKKIIKEEKVNVVHGHARIPSFICALLKRKMKFPFVTTAHWTFDTSHGLKHITKWGDKTIAVSEDIKKYLLHNYSKVKEQNIIVTVNGIDTEKFSTNADYNSILEEFNIDNSKDKIVYVSRLDESRALVARHLIEIAQELYEQNSNIEIIIVGGGDVFEELKNKAQNINNKLNKRLITMTGGRSDIYKFANMADIFIGVSRSVLEAMACEKPSIIAGNEGYIGIFSQDNLDVGINTNFCCRDTKNATPELLKTDVQKLLNTDKQQRKQMGIYNRDVVNKYYSIEKMVDDNIKAYELAIEDNICYKK